MRSFCWPAGLGGAWDRTPAGRGGVGVRVGVGGAEARVGARCTSERGYRRYFCYRSSLHEGAQQTVNVGHTWGTRRWWRWRTHERLSRGLEHTFSLPCWLLGLDVNLSDSADSCMRWVAVKHLLARSFPSTGGGQSVGQCPSLKFSDFSRLVCLPRPQAPSSHPLGAFCVTVASDAPALPSGHTLLGTVPALMTESATTSRFR